MRASDLTIIIKPVFKIGVLTLNPGDVIVLKSDRFLTMEQKQYAIKTINRYIPNNPCIVLDGKDDLKIIRKKDK